MKQNFKILKVAVVLTIAAIPFSMNADDRKVVILQHENNPTAFYGSDAFKQAVEAAQAGDIIQLSAGTFNSTTINIPVSIIGSGPGTILNGSTYIAIQNLAVGLEMQGVEIEYLYLSENLCEATFKRCAFNHFRISTKVRQVHKDLIFQQCLFREPVAQYSDTDLMNVYFGNSIFLSSFSIGSQMSEINVDHCVLRDFSSSSLSSISIKNSILRVGIPRYYDNYVISIANCIVPVNEGDMNPGYVIENLNFMSPDEIKNIFLDEADFKLTDAAKSMFKTTDGTEIGIYGGANPFTLVPAIPQIISSEIDPKMKEDGTITLKISAETNN